MWTKIYQEPYTQTKASGTPKIQHSQTSFKINVKFICRPHSTSSMHSLLKIPYESNSSLKGECILITWYGWGRAGVKKNQNQNRKKKYPSLTFKDLFKESWDTAMIKPKLMLLQLKRVHYTHLLIGEETSLKSTYRMQRQSFFWSWGNIWFKSECPPHLSSLAWSQATGREKEAQPFEPVSRWRDHKEVMKDQIAFLFPCWKVKTMKECIQLLPGAETNCNKPLSISFWGSKGDPARESQQLSG